MLELNAGICEDPGMSDVVKSESGVILRDPTDTDATREAIHAQMQKAVNTYINGQEFGDVRLEVSGVHLADKDRYSLREQREAKAGDKFLSRRLRGDVRLLDRHTGEVLDEKKSVTLMRVPWLTQNGTMIFRGSEYAPISQSRLLPGAYARRMGSGELEVHMNVRPGTGRAMRMTFRPEKAQYRLRVGTSDLHAFSVLKGLGVEDSVLEEAWGPEVLAMNKRDFDPRAVDRVYEKAVPSWEKEENPTREQKAEAVRKAFGKAEIAASIARKTLPHWQAFKKQAAAVDILRNKAPKVPSADRYAAEEDDYEEYVPVGLDGLVAASQKLLAINRGEVEPDTRDALSNDRIYTVDRLMAERVKLDDGKILRTLMGRLNRSKSLKAFKPNAFGRYTEGYLVGNPLASPLEEINPMQLREQMVRITKMGKGGIGDENVIGPDMQSVKESQFGFVDPVAGPESSRAGVDVRMAMGARIGEDGRIYQRFRDRRTGKVRWLSAVDVEGKTIKFPD